MKGNVEQYASGAGREALGFIKRIHSWAVSFYGCTQMVVGNPSVIGPMLLDCAGVCLARGLRRSLPFTQAHLELRQTASRDED